MLRRAPARPPQPGKQLPDRCKVAALHQQAAHSNIERQ
jgi:hypothetical protein